MSPTEGPATQVATPLEGDAQAPLLALGHVKQVGRQDEVGLKERAGRCKQPYSDWTDAPRDEVFLETQVALQFRSLCLFL